MGSNKLLLPLDGETLLRRAAKRAIAAGLSPVIVVLGHESDLGRAELKGLPVQVVLNPDYARGIDTSLKTGIAAVPEEARAAVVLLADMPRVTDQMIARLVGAYRESGAPLVVSDYAGVQAPPTLYGWPLFAELGAIEGEGCGKEVAKRHRSEAVAISWPVEALKDLDRPEDWEGMLRSHAPGPLDPRGRLGPARRGLRRDDGRGTRRS